MGRMSELYSEREEELSNDVVCLEKVISGLRWDLDSAHRTIRKLKDKLYEVREL
jgi:hypothetical protein